MPETTPEQRADSDVRARPTPQSQPWHRKSATAYLTWGLVLIVGGWLMHGYVVWALAEGWGTLERTATRPSGLQALLTIGTAFRWIGWVVVAGGLLIAVGKIQQVYDRVVIEPVAQERRPE